MDTSTPGYQKKLSRSAPIRVLIVDDSPVISTMLASMLEDAADIEVAGQAFTGQEAVRQALRLRPDVITMDIRMPQMDGLEATRQIMRVQPMPIVVVSSSVYAADYNIAFNAIEAGALTVIEKPKGLGVDDYDTVRDQLLSSIRSLAGAKLLLRRDMPAQAASVGPLTALLHTYFMRSVQVVAIASSTGGPPVLMQILEALPADFAIPIVIVQHILPAFVPGLVDWLNSRAKVRVELAAQGTRLQPGLAYLAPGDMHLTLAFDRTLVLDQSAPLNGQRPSATRLFQSVARACSAGAIGIVLTGMGEDGVDGLAAMSRAGAHIIAQSEATCTIFGMPKAAIDRKLVDEVLSPPEMTQRLIKLHRFMQSQR